MRRNKSHIQLKELEVFRGYAIISIVLYHYTYGYSNTFNFSNSGALENGLCFRYGYLGIYLFFVISGFVVFGALERNSPRKFILDRLSRLFPTYWVAVLMTWSVSLFSPLLPMISINEMLLNLIMIPNIPIIHKYIGVPYVDGVYWFLGVILVFYIVCFLFSILKLFEHINLLCSLWLVLQFIEIFIKFYSPGSLNYLYPFTLFGYANFFVAGIMFLKIKNGHMYLLYNYLMIFASLIISLLYWGVVVGIFTSFIYMIFYLFIKGKISIIINKYIVYVGSISYSLYLVHQNIGYVMINWLNSFSISFYINIFIVFSTMVGIASLLTYVIDKPIQSLLKTFLKNNPI